ncbi:S9 family peptidase [Glaciecola sp. KUL10]|uniref:alpha/beta hydrolase family protein n=1 Tax=Glaciecola sp. (strain KUL10) TaxID=2161813 RepID=UPI000D782FCE|nr:alpha/beta hydrolase [Glaciecola sp. KUL10]GBL05823.1 hypothetical protein KUL10_31560 [Glaciecola sp. KUL10]
MKKTIIQWLSFFSAFNLLSAISVQANNESLSMSLDARVISFDSGGTTLVGSLVYPKSRTIHAGVIFVHGSGKQKRWMPLAEKMAEEGIATFVYDKRGVGESEGEYEGKYTVSEKNIRLLSQDALAAFDMLGNQEMLEGLPLGMTGLSQAGWIVPVAAMNAKARADTSRNVVDFIVLWSGPVTKVSEEDIFSKYTADKDSARIPSYKEALNARVLPYVWPPFLGEDMDPSDSLKDLGIPGLWVFGKQDGSIPVDLSIERLEQIALSNPKYEYVLFSGQGHNNVGASLPLVVDWIKRQATP